ncbi:MAG: PAS domain S-box protein [Planctomycetes bacterium]|nr:PAS domain S-box protein [Planctomycetota bacterium]
MEDSEETQQKLRGEVEDLRRMVGSLREQLDKEIAGRDNLGWASPNSGERYRILVERNPHGIQEIDVCGTIIYANKAHHQMYGYQDGDLIGRSITDFLALDSQPDELSDYLKVLVEDQLPPTMYYQKILTAHGEERDIEVAWNYLRDTKGCVTGFISVLTDITDRERSKRELHGTKERLETILSLSPAGIYMTDADGKCIFVNRSWCEMTGLPEKDVLGDGWAKALHPDDRDRVFSDWHENIKSGGVWENEYRYITSDDKVIWVYGRATSIIDEAGNIKGYVGATIDITDRKQAEEQLTEAKKQAEAATIAKSQFLANMSHEIRTPMSVIMGLTDLLCMDELTDAQKSQIGLIQEAGRSLLQITEDILDVSRIEADKLELNLAKHSLKRLLDSVESMMRPLTENKDLQLTVICSNTLPSRIYTDYDRVHQCLLNIVMNAVKFTEKGHVRLKVALEDKKEHALIRFDVEDTGVGIPPDKLESIFETFTQIDVGKTRKYSGTGLGLAITKKLAEFLGGSLTVTSEIGEGSVFSLVIPAGLDSLDKQEPGDELVSESKIWEFPRFSGKVLVAEDYWGLRKTFRKLLERLGLEVAVAENGKEAVEIVLQQSFDLIFMDMQMPVLNGYTAIKELRGKGITTPIVALTAYVMETDRKECLEAGSDDYLSKPIDQEELKRILNKYVPVENDSA